MLSPGTLVDRYVVLGRLGKGGMGTVYSAHDPQLDRRVALKFLHTHLAGHGRAEWRTRLTREAQAMARLAHPNVVTVFDVGDASDGRLFVAMELVEGGTLARWLKEKKRTWREIVKMFCEAGEGLAAAHGADMIHRDFKLENVLIGKDGRPRVTDFGLARSVGAGAEVVCDSDAAVDRPSLGALSSSSLSVPLTMTGTLLGTPGYMAPEQYGVDGSIDARADIFAFCASLYRALYGERAFVGDTVDELCIATLNGRIRDAPRGSPVPAWLRRVVLRGLEVSPAARPGSMREVLIALRTDPARKRRRWIATGATVLAGCAVAFGVHAVGQRRTLACHAMADRLGGVWDARRKAAIEHAFAAAAGAFGTRTWERIEGPLDAYARSWETGTEQACEATRVRGEQSEAMLEARLACLDDRLDELKALGDVLATADRKVVVQAVEAAHSLSSLSPCSDLDHLNVTVRGRPEAAKRAEIRALEGEIAEARALSIAGRPAPSLDRLRRLGDRVRAARYDPLVVSWQMGVARAEMAGDTRASALDYEQAAFLADRLSLDRPRAEALLALGLLEEWFSHFDEGHRVLRLADAAIARAGGDATLQANLDQREGWLFMEEGRFRDASASLERSLAEAEAAFLDDPEFHAAGHAALGFVLVALGRFNEGLGHMRASVRVAEEAYGPEHFVVAKEVTNLSCVQLDAGQLDEALATASRATAMFEAAALRADLWPTSGWFGTVAQVRGAVLLRMRRAPEAAEQLARAREIYRATGEERSELAAVDNDLAEAWRLIGRATDARLLVDEASEIEGRVEGIRSETIAGTLEARADIAMAAGNSSEALSLAERGLARLQEGEPRVYQLAAARLRVASFLALHRNDSARARSLAEQARAGFEKLHDQRRLEEVSALLDGLR